MQTADNWGIDPSQCSLPGYGAPQLFSAGTDGLPAPTSYPVTYDRKQACGMAVFRSDLVDRNNQVGKKTGHAQG